MATGESPARCAAREIQEEAGIDVPIERLHLLGLISECSYEGDGHWLLFYYRVIGPVCVRERRIDEGTLEWFERDRLPSLPVPETDHKIIWPLVREHESVRQGVPHGFFAVHIDCRDGRLRWSVDQSQPPGEGG